MEKKYIEDIVEQMGKNTKVFDYAECKKSEEGSVLKFKARKKPEDTTEKEWIQKAQFEVDKYFEERLERTFYLTKGFDSIIIALDENEYPRKKNFDWVCRFTRDYRLYSYNSNYEIWEYHCSISRDEKNEIISRMLNSGQISRFKGCFYEFEDTDCEEGTNKIVISETKEIIFDDSTKGFLIISSSMRGSSFVDKLNSRYFHFDESSRETINEVAREVAYDIKKAKILKKITKGQKLSLLREYFEAEDCREEETGAKVVVEKIFVDEKQTMCVLLSTGRHILFYRNGEENPHYISIEEISKRSVEFTLDEILKSFGKFDFLLKNLIYYGYFRNTNSLKRSVYKDRSFAIKARLLGNENFSCFKDYETIEKLWLKMKRRKIRRDRRYQYAKNMEKYGDKIFVRSEDGRRVGYGVIEYIIENYRPSENECADRIRADILYKQVEGTIHEGIVLDIIIDIIREDYPVFIL